MISKKTISDVIFKVNSKIPEEIFYYGDLSIDINEIDIGSIDTLSDLQDSLENYVYNEPKYEIIYFGDANEYLSHNDPSFTEAMEHYIYFYGIIDSNFAKHFNSGDLATAHLRGKIYEIIDKVIDEFSENEANLEDDKDEEE